MLRCLEGMLSAMHKELEYRLTPLPELCRYASQLWTGKISKVLLCFSEELERDRHLDAVSCMTSAMGKFPDLPPRTRCGLELFGRSVGRYDLAGQLQGLDEVASYCQQELGKLSDNRESRLQSYQTLGLCAGAALVILFI